MMILLDDFDTSIVKDTLQKVSAMQATIKASLKVGHDYDTIPGTGKPTLLKPGAEKILMMFGLTSEYEIVDSVVDYQKGVFAYTIRCILSKGSSKITEGLGSCNSYEKKYRYRWAKKDDIPAGVDPSTLKTNNYGKYQIENDEIQDQANTILKMAKKRAQVDAVLTVASLSEVFTQDVEDMAQFRQSESLETMTLQDAQNMKIGFGKHAGKTLAEIDSVDKQYLEWLSNNGKDAEVRQACKMIMHNAFNQAQAGQAPQSTPKKPNNGQDDFFEADFEEVTDDKIPF